MKKVKKILAVVLTAALALGIAAGCAAQKTNESSQESKTSETAEKTKITFVLDWTPNTNHTGLYVAQDKGYFSDAGLEVEIVQPPEDGAEMLVGANKAQFGVSFQDSMLKGKGMDKPKGMEGKKYATWDLPIEKATLKQVIEADGGDFSKVELIPSTVTDEVSALQSGAVDAIWIFYGWAGVATEVAGLETDYFAFKDIDPVFDYYTPVIIGNSDWMKENPDTAKAFLSAMKKGYEFAVENPDEAADILLKNAPELDKELVKASQKYLSKEYKSDVDRWGYIDPSRWNAFYNWINDNSLFEVKVPENTGFSNEYLPE